MQPYEKVLHITFLGLIFSKPLHHSTKIALDMRNSSAKWSQSQLLSTWPLSLFAISMTFFRHSFFIYLNDQCKSTISPGFKICGLLRHSYRIQNISWFFFLQPLHHGTEIALDIGISCAHASHDSLFSTLPFSLSAFSATFFRRRFFSLLFLPCEI